MLTGDLLQFTRRGGRIQPRRVNPADPRLCEAAEGLIGLFRDHIGQRRGDLEELISRLVPPGQDPKRMRGLARLLWERCEFQVAAATDPVVLRQALFDAAAEEWRRFSECGSANWRSALVERAAIPLALSPEQADAALYADLEENQVVTAFDPITPERLLDRFNVAQVQGLLLRAERMQIRAFWPTPQRMRQLLRYLKFYRLLFSVNQVTTPGQTWIELTVDGPLSILEGATRYGLNLAQFFPALLLWDVPWRMTAEIRVKGPGSADVMEVEPHPALRSHYPDRGQWVPDDVRDFVTAFNATPGPWRAEAAEDVLILPGNAFLVPDFRFTHAPTGRVVAMEHVLHPAPDRIAALLERTKALDAPRYTLAFRQFRGSAVSPRMFTYRRTLTPAPVREWLEGLPW